MKENKKAIIKQVSIAVAVICVIGLMIVVSHTKLSSVEQSLIGTTLRGTYEYRSYGYYNYLVNEYVTLEIIDENYCSVSVEETRSSDGDITKYSYQNRRVPYTLGGGLLGVKFNWSYHDTNVPGPARPFKVIISNNEEITLITPNWNSGTGLTLKGYCH